MSKYRGVLLDIDGTLVDSNDAHAHAWVEALHRGGHDVAFEKARRLIGMGSDNFLPAAAGVTKSSPEGQQLTEWWEEIFKEKYLPNLEPFPRSGDLVRKLHDNRLKLVVATSAKEEMVRTLLRLAGAEKYIDGATSADQAEHSKPDPDIVVAALGKIGLRAQDVVMLGDTPYDVEASRKAGVDTIALRCGGWDTRALQGAVAVYDDPADLLAHYGESPLGG